MAEDSNAWSRSLELVLNNRNTKTNKRSSDTELTNPDDDDIKCESMSETATNNDLYCHFGGLSISLSSSSFDMGW